MNRNTEHTLEIMCEYLKAPVGIQNRSPRFSWKAVDRYRYSAQKAYRILVKDEAGHVMWDSGKTESVKNAAVVYRGEALRSFCRYQWSVNVWVEDSDGNPAELQDEDFFEMGILDQEEWKGCWICADGVPENSAPLFRKEFELETIPERARLYLSGIGYSEAYLNGNRLGDAFLDPGWTNYNKTVLYRTYDVEKYLVKGKNILALEAGGGWLENDHRAFENMVGRKPIWLSAPKIYANLYLDERCIATMDDGSWMCSEGPVTQCNVYDGETYDASKEKKGYELPSYEMDGREWRKAGKAEAPSGVLTSQMMPPIRKVKEHDPVYIDHISEGEQCKIVVDFGVNFSGWIQLSAIGETGQKIRIQYAETIDENHTANQKNLRYAKAEDVYVFGAEKNIRYHPKFTYHGFRYAQISMDRGVVVTEAKGWEIHSDVKKSGEFTCSDPLLNRIQAAMQQTEQNNLHSIPTDCPQRDERMGWLNDMTVRFEEAMYNFDMILFYENWLQDILDEQREDGAIPDTAPYVIGRMPARHPSSAFVLIPWYLYRFYDDTQILDRFYEPMKRYVGFKLGERDERGLLPEVVKAGDLPNKYMGDWAPPMTEAYLGYICNAVPKNVSQSLLTTSYLYYDCRIMEEASRTLGKQEDAAFYRQMQEELSGVLNRTYLGDGEGYDTNSQSSNLFPLFLDYVPFEKKEAVFDHVLQDLIRHNYHITTGNQMTKYLFEVLNREKRDDIAYRIAADETYPSLGFMLKNGATTIWERWEYLTNKYMNSHDHPMLGAYTSWFYKGLAGIHPEPGRIRLSPAVIGELDFVEAWHEFVNGTCRIRWEKTKMGVEFRVEIPWNMSAVIDLSHCQGDYDKVICGEEEFRPEAFSGRILSSGEYRFALQRIREERV